MTMHDNQAAPTAQSNDESLARYRGALMPLFAPKLVLSHGDGAEVWDVDGKRYLDLFAGIAVNALGHNHPALVSAASKQVAQAMHVSNVFATPQQIALAERLLGLAGAPDGSGVFFTNSGTESNEAAFKIARRTGKSRILALENSFHGRTMGALALTWKEQYRTPFAPLPGCVEFLPANDTEALRVALEAGDVAAVIVEPIQGEAGVLPLEPEYLLALRSLTREHGSLLIVDEVQTGIGRTGAWFAHQLAGIQPDVMTLAKGLGGGFPIGAVLTFGTEVTALLSAGQHGTTFGGNAFGAAISLAVLDTIEGDDLLTHVGRVSEDVRAYIEERPELGVAEVRGAGLLLGLRLTEPLAPAVVAAGLERGYLLNATDDSTLRLAPALIISTEQITGFLDELPDLIASAKDAQKGEAS